MKKENIIEKLIQGVIFIVLLIIFYSMYMKTAIEQFTKGSTTISQTPKIMSKLEPPTFIFCPDPSFKHSFFKSHNIRSLGTEKYFWLEATLSNYLPNKFENHSALDLYTKMSHQYGSDWKILLLDFRYVLPYFLNTGFPRIS